ncbi:MAG: metal ABC transporter substrate-binding protein [Armatimonadota bacterium]|nr:metal ABC transporter substrate-binding protein [Armatimonadota bacterium]MDR7438654.1 metal ABC transporter substrate-binding protein [Armatimonadota bacterium]MDR7568640.1 metal ABC transporter substrate-binding protein [Armatimonadota bacterium]MDR7601829.1 metal ABC transporter substrate-binding protein [Armatimonadota bacterium]
MRRLLSLLGILLAACTGPAGNPGSDKPRVVATISILADFTRQVAGDRLLVHSLLPVGTDPHTYEPVPRDVQRIAEAQVVVYNGLKLEKWLEKLLENAGGQFVLVEATRGLRPTVQETGPYRGDPDPHLWMDPVFVQTYVRNIRDALVAFDPAGRAIYTANAERYLRELVQLDRWIREQIRRIPPAHRKLVTTHDAFRYFGHRYDLRVVGTIWGISTEDEPSAQEIARLVDRIRQERVPAVFVETTINPKLMERVAREAGVRIGGKLYGDSLGPPGSGADTYLGMMRHNVEVMVEALR